MDKLEIIGKWDLLGKSFTIYGTLDIPLFLAREVATLIEYTPGSINKMLSSTDASEKVRKIIPTPGGPQECWFLTENGLYEVLMQSRKPIAKEFKKRVKEILQSIRKTGSYALPKQQSLIVCLEDLIIQQAMLLKELRHKVEMQGKRIEEMGQTSFVNCIKYQSCEIWLVNKKLPFTRDFIWHFSRRCAKYSRKHGIAIRETGKCGYSINAYREDVLEACFKTDIGSKTQLYTGKPVEFVDLLKTIFNGFPKAICESMFDCFPQWCFAIPDKFRTAVWQALYASVYTGPIRKIG